MKRHLLTSIKLLILFTLLIYSGKALAKSTVHYPGISVTMPGVSVYHYGGNTHVYPHGIHLHAGYGYGWGSYGGYYGGYGLGGYSYGPTLNYAPLASPNYQQYLMELGTAQQARWEKMNEDIQAIIKNERPLPENQPEIKSPQIETQEKKEVQSTMLRVEDAGTYL